MFEDEGPTEQAVPSDLVENADFVLLVTVGISNSQHDWILPV